MNPSHNKHPDYYDIYYMPQERCFMVKHGASGCIQYFDTEVDARESVGDVGGQLDNAEVMYG